MDTIESTQDEQNNGWLFLGFTILFMLAFYKPLWDLVVTSYRSDTFSYIPFIPLLSVYVLNIDKREIFSQKKTLSLVGLIPISIGIVMVFFTRKLTTSLDHNDYLSLITLSMVLIWFGGFGLCYGLRSLRVAAFPLLFLFFMVPIPAAALDKIISVLQTGSTMVADGFFKVARIPTVREGFVFHFQTINIEVAKECSGIRSALSLLIIGLMAGHFYLRTGWTKFILFLLLVPIAVVKNGFRIAVLSILGVYVDKRILGSELHRNGGILFFVLALLLLGAVIALLRKAEGRRQVGNGPQFLAEKKK